MPTAPERSVSSEKRIEGDRRTSTNKHHPPRRDRESLDVVTRLMQVRLPPERLRNNRPHSSKPSCYDEIIIVQAQNVVATSEEDRRSLLLAIHLACSPLNDFNLRSLEGRDVAELDPRPFGVSRRR